MIARETIFQALFALVSGLPGFVTWSRRGRLAKDVAPEEQPALFQEEGPGEVVKTQGEGLSALHYLYVDLGFYVRIPDDKLVAPGSLINPLIDVVCAALEPDEDEERQTLGKKVYHCRVEGKILKNEGLLDGQASVVIPVEILI